MDPQAVAGERPGGKARPRVPLGRAEGAPQAADAAEQAALAESWAHRAVPEKKAAKKEDAGVRALVEDIAGAPIAIDAPLLASGLDSLGVEELAAALGVPATVIFDAATIRGLEAAAPRSKGDAPRAQR